mmetsp:Transcript_33164/g.79384  ORF Transcript_33164/g.79384 Transcript_33164/m.79384 type:complete len:211 (+) Transcript_33164:273-905(+)
MFLLVESRRPCGPVGLCVVVTIVQRNAVALSTGSILNGLLLENTVGEEALEIQHLLPYQVILLGPRSRKIILPSEMVPVSCSMQPIIDEALRELLILHRLGLLPRKLEQLCVGRKGHDALSSKVDIVRVGALEIVCAQLVAGVWQRCHQEVGPGLQERPVAAQPFEVSQLLGHGSDHNEHVAALLHRHLLLLVAAQGTDGPSAEVVRRPG